MSGDEPYAEHNGVLLLLLIITGLIATPILAGYCVRLLIRAMRAEVTAWRSGAAAAWSAVLGLYTWGLLHLLFFDEAAQAEACRKAVGSRLSGYATDFVPLRFGCRTTEGQVVEAVIPNYLNPAIALLALCAVALTGIVIARHKKDSR